jgi:serralysin
VPVVTKKPPVITVDGNLSEWTTDQLIETPANTVAGYNLYGTVENGTYYIAIQATSATDPVIGPGTTIWLNTDQNTATGYSPFGSIGADYNITNVGGSFYLYTGAAGQNLVSATPLTAALSPNGESLEIAIPRSLVTPTGGTAPTNINVADWINTGAVYQPTDYTLPEYTITDPATLQTVAPTHKVAIVYSDTSANLYFNQTAYSDLFMAAQNQARMAGVSYDVIDESQLTNINNLLGYDALIFPSMPDVNTAQLPAIMATLTSAVYNYHIGIITAGDFLTNDQTGAPLPGNSYANMETLLNLQRYDGGNSGTVQVTANDVSNPIMKGYTAGQVIQNYTNEGYAAYRGVTSAADVLVNQNVTPAGSTTATTLPGVVETTTGGTNVHFATTDLEGDSNLLSNAIQATVLGTQPGIALHMSRDAGVVAVRMDMDQSQFPADVSPVGGGGIYSTLIPILQQWNQQYDFTGTFFVNIGDNPTGADPSTTNWATSLPYYQAIQAIGGEIGNHSYTHLINPPTTTFTATTVGDTPPNSTQITLSSVPSFAGVTVGMFVTGTGLGTNTPLPGAAGEGGSVANTQVTAVSGNTITISYVPGGYGTANDGTLADIPAGTTLTFSIPAENTNFLQTTGTVLSGDGQPFTYAYEFGQAKALEQTQLGSTIYGAAIPGANETVATDQNILPYYQSVAPTATTAGYTGYLTGGWTGIGSGYPSAFGYLTPSALDQGSVYLAPNMTFDFTEIQYQGKTLQQAEADWAAQFSSLSADAAGTPIIELPIHDYGAAAWNTTTDTGTGSPYSTSMYTTFIQQAYNANYEFVTLEDLASRIAAQQKATIDYTTSGNTITATVTPDPSAPDVGEMALSVINGGTEVIQNVTNWYAYNSTELFLPKNGGTFTVNLGTTQDNVTHIASLPMRADLVSVAGDGTNLSFSVVGSGNVVVDLGAGVIGTPLVTGATIASLVGNQLTLTLSGSGQQNVSVNAFVPKVAMSVASPSANEGSSDAITITGTPGIAGDTLTYTLSGIPTDAALSDTAGALTVTGGSVTLTQAQLAGLSLQLGETNANLSVTATETNGTITSAPSTPATAAITAIPVAEIPTVALSVGSALVVAGGSDAITITGTPFDADDTLSYTLSGIPADATLSDTTGALTVTGGSVALTQAQLAGLTLQLGATAANLSVTATSTEGGLTSAPSTPAAASIAVLNPPTVALSVALSAVNEGSSDAITITGTLAIAGDALTYTLSGIPADATLSDTAGALAVTGGSVTLTQAQLVGLNLQLGETNASLLVTATETNGTVTSPPSAPATAAITATPVAEVPTVAMSVASATVAAGGSDAITITGTPGDADDTLNFTLSGIPTDATLSDTAGALTVTGGSITLTQQQLAGLTLKLGATNANLSVTATATEGTSTSAASTPATAGIVVAPGQTYTLTAGTDTITGAVGNNTIAAKSGTLNAGDNINAGPSTNTLALQGGGAFNLAAPATLTNIAIITAQEGQGTTAPTVTLRAGLNATVNVASDTVGDASPTITINGAANSDVINLGSGNDTVTLGAGETVNSGGGNNAFKVASANLGSVTINGGTKGANTLTVTGGGTTTMGAGITGVATVQLAAATNFTANATSGLHIIGSAGADTITAGGSNQVLTGGAGADTLIGSSAGYDIFRDVATGGLNNDTIANLLPTDIIDITNFTPTTTVISNITASATSTVLTITNGTTNANITLSGSYVGNFVLAPDTTGGGGTDVTFVPTSSSIITLPTTAVNITTPPVSTTIVATASTLLPADKITGGTGTGVTNTLLLSGGGAFNLAAVSKLTNVQVIAAQEGQGSTAQTVTLRAGLNATVNVAPDTAGDPSPGITIIGAANSDVINLGAGADTVTLGAGETVNGGTGSDTYIVTKGTIGNVTINGGSGTNTLVVAGGGTAAMGSKITGINAVQLATTTKFTANATAGLQISGSSAGGDVITLGAPNQSVVAGGANENIKASAANAGAAVSGLGANGQLEITSGGTVTLNAVTNVATVKLDASTNLALNGMSFISAVGSSAADTIQAGATHQTLTGGAGADTLIGYSGGFDTFRDTAAGLNNDTIQGFVASDTIDLSNVASAGATLTTTASGANTKVTVISGATKSVFTLAGSWSTSGFHLASDGSTGTLVTHV